jgi:mono/diheme cytochrome c family protein
MKSGTRFFSRKSFAVAFAAFTAVFLGVQFIRPPLPNPPVTADFDAPAHIKQIFRTACYNCHSNETRLSWFDRIVPAYWLVTSDVKEARAHLNFSEMGGQPARQQQETLSEVFNQMQSGDMPPRSYRLLHSESKITPEELATLKSYLDPYRQRPAADAAQFASADVEYEEWVRSGNATASVRPAPNGIGFIPEYKDWKMVSATERFDSQNIRLVLGNDVAIRAVESDRINPWPDGTIFAKVAWERLTGEDGAVRTGKFWQVEFMIKDSRKYASSLGWGFARWRGADLEPFGKDADFVQACVGCHMPMRANDFVFTMPVKAGK